MLPTGIAKPILPLSSPAAPTPAGGAQSAKTSVNPLLGIFTGVKPSALLLKHARQDVPDWDSLRAEVDKTDEKALLQSAQSFDTFNMALELRRVTAPTLLLHGEDDGLITPPPLELLRRIETSKQPGQFLSMIEPGLKHFPMIEITAKFNRLLVDFLEAPDLSNVQFKDQWKRTIR
ncbi:hypothetical protein ARNL5_02640 [Anaerolineae bacterium]|nr:hypothetical protein ARNL5_02640 [Anaerolineae bacterium]